MRPKSCLPESSPLGKPTLNAADSSVSIKRKIKTLVKANDLKRFRPRSICIDKADVSQGDDVSDTNKADFFGNSKMER